MGHRPASTRPTYMVESVDRALRLLQLVRDYGVVRVSTAAAELDISESTAHRLLAMLVYHGFAVQDESRAYRPGPSLGAGPPGLPRSREVAGLAVPFLDELRQECGETVNLAVRVGTTLHFLWRKQGDAAQSLDAPRGTVIEAHETAAGRMLLSPLSKDELTRLYDSAYLSAGDIRAPDVDELARSLDTERRQGYSIAMKAAPNVAALAVPIRDADGTMVAAIGVAVPPSRSSLLVGEPMLAAVRRTRDAVEARLRALS